MIVIYEIPQNFPLLSDLPDLCGDAVKPVLVTEKKTGQVVWGNLFAHIQFRLKIPCAIHSLEVEKFHVVRKVVECPLLAVL